MFLEHDDIYRGGGHQHIVLGPKLVDRSGRPETQSSCDRGTGQSASASPPAKASV
jgi:hypothetical protein